MNKGGGGASVPASNSPTTSTTTATTSTTQDVGNTQVAYNYAAINDQNLGDILGNLQAANANALNFGQNSLGTANNALQLVGNVLSNVSAAQAANESILTQSISNQAASNAATQAALAQGLVNQSGNNSGVATVATTSNAQGSVLPTQDWSTVLAAVGIGLALASFRGGK